MRGSVACHPLHFPAQGYPRYQWTKFQGHSLRNGFVLCEWPLDILSTNFLLHACTKCSTFVFLATLPPSWRLVGEEQVAIPCRIKHMVPQCGWFRKSQVHTRNIRFVFCHRSKSLFLFSVFFTFNVSEIFELFTFHSFILYFFMFTASLAFWSGECDGGDCWLLPGITVVVLLLYFRPARDVVDHKQFEITWIVLTVVRAVLGNTVQIRSSQCIYMCVWSSCATQELQPDSFVLGPVDRLSTRLSLKNDRSKKIELEDFLQKNGWKKEEKRVLRMRFEYTTMVPAVYVDVAHRCAISRNGKLNNNLSPSLGLFTRESSLCD